ncbi:hypothetical protein EZV62_010181 [Acer yangbiense]|uniref:Meiosis-specific protein ASY3-like coiled-coil domain-containing protein n=1 Tax=Acer yangbiense TaxID=1000413 RepID=A0A5C7I1L8_9ROSI|nr:hypothetical protein EZV62_010181 [Acer yangbiense]
MILHSRVPSLPHCQKFTAIASADFKYSQWKKLREWRLTCDKIYVIFVQVVNLVSPDRVNNCQSFGSIYHPSSQSRKISIGITVDSQTKKKPKDTKKAEVEVPNAEGINCNKENFTEPKTKGEGTTTANKGKQIDGTEQVSSPWITTRSSHQKTPTLENVLHTKQSRPATGGRQKKLNGVKDKQGTYSVQFFGNENTILQTNDGSQKKFNGITYRRMKEKDRGPECLEDFAFATAQDVTSSDKAVITDKMDKPENGRSETLRMKLWEILGTVASPKSQNSDPKASEAGADKLKQKEVVDQTGDTVVKPRQNSDSIETDSEGPNQPTMRPLTRSLTRKRASTKVQQNKTKIGSCSTYKQKHEKKNIFSFEEGWSVKLDGAINSGSSIPARKKIQRKSSAIKPRKISFLEKDNAGEPQRASYSRKSPPQIEKTSSLGKKVDSFRGCPPEERRNYFEAKNNIQENDCQSPVSKTMNQTGDFHNPTLVENRNHQEDCNHRSLKNVFDPLDEFQSPTLAFKTPTLSPSPCSMPSTVQMEQDCTPGPDETRFSVGNFCSFRTLQTPKSDCSGSDAETESPDDAEQLKDSPSIEPSPAKEKKDAENGLVESSSEDEDPRSSEEDSPIIKRYGCQREISPETGTAKDENCIHYPTKRLRRNGGIKLFSSLDQTFSIVLYFIFMFFLLYFCTIWAGIMESDRLQEPTQNQEDDWLQEPTEQNQEDDLTRVVTLFAFALDNFRKKMDAVTKKKSSEILMSVSEEIHLQLKNVESQIQTDIGKLTGLSKSKRKRLETSFGEQQEQLKLIQENFKKDIHQHLQECRSILEVMEAHQIELKGTVKKQIDQSGRGTSHQKLLLQLEEAVETQLSDAQRRITTVHEASVFLSR